MLTLGGVVSLEATVMLPSAAMVTVLSPTGTVQTPFVLLALAAIGAQPTRTRMMISAAVEGCMTTALPWYCAAALGSDGAALTPHELKSAADIGVNSAVCPAQPS